MLVGDSLSQNMWESLLCMIYASVPNAKYSWKKDLPSSVTFQVRSISPSFFFFSNHINFVQWMTACLSRSLFFYSFVLLFRLFLIGNAALFCYFHFSHLASFLYSHILLYSYELLYSNYLLTENLTIFILNKNKITMKCMNVRQTYQDGKPQVDPCYLNLYSSWGRGRFLLPGLTIMK